MTMTDGYDSEDDFDAPGQEPAADGSDRTDDDHPEQPPAAPSRPATTVLTVDDQEPIRASFRFFLEDCGLRVLDAESGRRGIEMAAEHRPDLVLLDLRMPGLSGLEALSELQRQQPDLPVIVVSGTNAVDEVVEALRRGASDYLIKPVSDLSILRHAIDRALERARLLRNEREHRSRLEFEVARRTQDLRRSESKYRRIFESLQDVYCEVLLTGTIAEVSPSVSSVFGYWRRELIGQPLSRLGLSTADSTRLFEELCRNERISDRELTLRDRNGRPKPCAISARLVRNRQGTPVKISGMLRDISERKLAEAEIAFQAYHDDLTGLPNRALLMERLARQLDLALRQGPGGAVLFLDLDHFKTINDSLGHAVGDALLVQVAERLSRCLRPSDTAARIGGDEFLVLLGDLDRNPPQAAVKAAGIAEALRATLAKKFLVNDYELYVTPSIGSALVPSDAITADDALKFADAAMYQAKRRGRNLVCPFQPNMLRAAQERLLLEQELREAIDGDQLQLYFQPQFDARGCMVGAEALLRWPHPARGLVGPDEFIATAEESGLVLAIGDWVLQTAFRWLGRWQRRGLLASDQRFSINLSPRQFQQPDLVERMQYLLRHSGLDPRLIKLELTEQMMIDNLADAITKMEALQAFGVSFAIDDFGTGYSSLAYLNKLPVDTLKIDRSFVHGLTENENHAVIVDTIVAMAHHLQLWVVAEGVETIEEFDFLRDRGCQLYQGYYFSRPVPAADIADLLPARGNWSAMSL